MKIAITVPGKSFRRVTRVAKKHDMNRSQFYARAAERYADYLEASDVTSAVDALLSTEPVDGSAEFAVAAGRRVLADEVDEW